MNGMTVGLAIAGLVFLGGAAAIVLLEIRRRRESRDASRWRRIERSLSAIERLEALGALAGGIAHEFNNVLFVIIGYADMALEQLGPDHPARRDLEEVLAAGERAKGLTTQILELSRGSGEERGPLRVGPLVKELIKRLELGLPEGVSITHRVDDEGLHLVARPVEIFQIVLHLCLNAIEAMRPAGGELTVELRSREVGGEDTNPAADLAPGSYLVLTVSDSGPGLPAGAEHRVFEPLFSTKPPEASTGLGLPAVRTLARELGGEIVSRSGTEAGATFEVYLPAAPRGRGQRGACLLS